MKTVEDVLAQNSDQLQASWNEVDRIVQTLPTRQEQIWFSIVIMICTVLVPLAWDMATIADQQALQTQLAQQAVQARQQFGQSLNHELQNQKVKNVLVMVADTKLQLQVLNESPKAARRDGLKPLDRNLLFTKLLRSNMETNLCSLGFRTIQIRVNADSAGELALACSSTQH
jgi:hypothetical protein